MIPAVEPGHTMATPEVRNLSKGMRAVFIVGSVLVAAAAVQLYLLSDRTDHWFAWTIQVPLTAAFLGGFYFTALALAGQSAVKRIWVEARVAVPGVFVFITLTFVLTLLHLGKFHFHSPDRIAKGAAYLWFAIYLADPPFVAVAWFLQLRRPGRDPPRRFPLPVWYRAMLAVQGAFFLVVGVALFVAPDATKGIWPWPLTPLTARAVAAWVVALGLVVGQAAWENAWERIDIATIAYAVLGTLQGIALARYPSDVQWGRPAAWIYVAIVASMFGLGVYGWTAGRRVVRAGSAGMPAEAGETGPGLGARLN
jgi:uncharacterized membrane protein